MFNTISPYSYMSNLKSESINDGIIRVIKKMCKMYIETEDIRDFFLLYTISDILYSIEFVSSEFIKATTLQKELGLDDVADNFVQIGHSLDMITLKDEINFDSRSLYYELGIQLSALKDTLGFCTVVLNKILETWRGNESNNKGIDD